MKTLFAVTVAILLSMAFELKSQEFETEDIHFTSQSVRLVGTLVTPSEKEASAAVVFVHGSGKQTRNIELAKMFATEGIAAFVYDKRGVGASKGVYENKASVGENNLNLLADDAASAVKALQTHSKTNHLPIGLTGISQAGWIVPLAAEKVNSLSFMVLWSGPVVKVSEEDIYSKYTKDLDKSSVPSYQQALDARVNKYRWPRSLGIDTNPSDSLRKINVPGLWVFGKKDGSIPVDLSIIRLAKLIENGAPYEYVLYSRLGHNNIQDSFPLVVHWIHETVDSQKTKNSNIK